MATKKGKSKELTIDEAFSLLLKHAPEHHTVEDLCDAIKLPRDTYYAWTKGKPKFRKQITDALAKRFTLTKQQTEQGKLVTITITYKEAERARNNHHTPEERQRLTDLVCYAYELGVSVRESCTKIGLNHSTFYKWINPNSGMTYAYAVERFKLAKETFNADHNEELSFTARTRLYEKLQERKKVNTTYQYETRGAEGNDFVLVGKTEHERVIEPEMAAISLALNNLDPNFSKATAAGLALQNDEFAIRAMNEEELQEEIRKEELRLKTLKGETASE